MKDILSKQGLQEVEEVSGLEEVRQKVPVSGAVEVLSQDVLDNLEEVLNMREVSNVKELSRVQPLVSKGEVLWLDEIYNKIEIPDYIAKKFLANREDDAEGEDDKYDGLVVINKMEILTKKMVKKLQ